MMTRVWFFKKSAILLYFLCCHLVRLSILYRDIVSNKEVPSDLLNHGLRLLQSNNLAFSNSRAVYFYNLNFFKKVINASLFDILANGLIGGDFLAALRNHTENPWACVNSNTAERNPWAVSERITVNYTMPKGFDYSTPSNYALSYVIVSKATVDESTIIPNWCFDSLDN